MDNTKYKISPTEKQTSFITTKKRYACYSAGYGAGKTFSGCLRGLVLSSYPNNVGLIGRNSYPELRDTTRKTLFEVCPTEYYDDKRGGRWSPSENHLKFINGSEILFRHLDTISENELKSLNLGWFYIDQAEEININVWRVLQSRLRLNRVPKRYGFITCNPDPGSWIDEIFHTPFEKGELDPDMFYMDGTTYDNPYNPPEYVEDLKKRYPPELVKRYVEGRWDVLENIIYKEFDPKIHVIRPFTIPKSWERIVVVDHGMVNPTGMLLAVIDYDYNIFIVDEYYAPGIVSQHAKAILEKVGDQEISLFLIDPSTQAKTREKEGRPYSIIEEYEDYGLYFIPANNNKLAGINRVKEFLMPQQDRISPITHKKPSPRLFIFQHCVNLQWEMKQYKWRKLRSLTVRNSPEEPVDYADHLCLTGDTLILIKRDVIESYYEKIKNIKIGDEVFTPFGWRKVLVSKKTKEKADIVEIGFSNKQVLRGTPEHPIWNGKSFVRLDSLYYGDIIESCLNLSFLTAYDTIDIPIQEGGNLGVILQRAGGMADFILIFGNFIMEKFNRAFAFIIKTGILLITILLTLSWLMLDYMRNVMVKKIGKILYSGKSNSNTLEKSIQWRKNGTLQRKDTNGIKNMVDCRGQKQSLLKKTAFTVIRVLKPLINIFRDSVLLGVRRLGEENLSWISKSVRVGSAVNLLKLVNMAGQEPVQENALVVLSVKRNSKKEPVYNLKVEGGVYFVGEILSSNCDCLYMFCISRFPAPEKVPLGEPLIRKIDYGNKNTFSQSIPESYRGDSLFGQVAENPLTSNEETNYE